MVRYLLHRRIFILKTYTRKLCGTTRQTFRHKFLENEVFVSFTGQSQNLFLLNVFTIFNIAFRVGTGLSENLPLNTCLVLPHNFLLHLVQLLCFWCGKRLKMGSEWKLFHVFSNYEIMFVMK